MSRTAWLNIYKKLISECGKFSDYNFRSHAIRRVKYNYEQHLDESDERNLSCLIKRAEEDLKVMQRQLEDRSKSDHYQEPIEIEIIKEEFECLERKSNHHQGPVPTDYIPDRKKRVISFCKRSKTLLKLAKDLHQITGAKVELVIINNDRKKQVLTYYSHSKSAESDDVHSGNELLATSANPGAPTLTRRECKYQVSEDNFQPIANTMHPVKPILFRLKKHVCQHCDITFDSTADRLLQETAKPSKKFKWIVCDEDYCDYWGHAFCLGVVIEKGQNFDDIFFTCPEHRQ